MRRAVLRASLGIPAENTVLVCVGRLAEEKNIQELLKLRASLAPPCDAVAGGGWS